MYKIVKDNVTIGMAERPNFIRLGENGAFLLCSEQEARGVAYEGVPYHLGGMEPMEGADLETVVLVPVDAGTVLYERLEDINNKIEAALNGNTAALDEALAILRGEVTV